MMTEYSFLGEQSFNMNEASMFNELLYQRLLNVMNGSYARTSLSSQPQ